MRLDGYSASWSPKRGRIECSVARYDAGRPVIPDYEETTVRSTLRELGLDLDDDVALDPTQSVYLRVKGDALISIGPRSDVQAVLDEVLPGSFTQYLTLRIDGIDVETHDDAVDLLERVGNAIFLEVGISHGIQLQLEDDSIIYDPLAEFNDMASTYRR